MHTHKARHAAATCDVVFANSQSTADDLVELLGIERGADRARAARAPATGFSPDGDAADLGGPAILGARHDRAAQEPRAARRGVAAARRRARARRSQEARAGVTGPISPTRGSVGSATSRTRSSRASTAVRPCYVYPSLLRGVRDPDRRGDGLRHARRRVVPPVARRGLRRCRGPRRPARPGGDRGGHPRGARAPRRARPARPRARGAVLVGREPARRCSRPSRSAHDGHRRPEEVARRRPPSGEATAGVPRRPPLARQARLLASRRGRRRVGTRRRPRRPSRELREETGLDAAPEPLGGPLDYDLAGDPESVRERFPPGTERSPSGRSSPTHRRGWEPTLDEEHVDHRWLDADAAIDLLHYPEPREAVRTGGGLVRVGDRHDAARADPRRDRATRPRSPRRARRADRGSSSSGSPHGGVGRLATVRRDALWYPLRLGGASDALDVLHCTTFRAPVRAARAARRHRPRPRRSSGIPRRSRAGTGRPARARCGRRPSGRRGRRRLGLHARRARRRCSASRASGSASSRTASTRSSRRTAPPPTATTCSPSGRSSRGRTSRAAVEAARLAGVELRVAGAAGWGGVAAQAGSASRPTTSSRR